MAGTITSLRDIVPVRPLTFNESMRITELQAVKLLALSGVEEPPVPETIISSLPHVQVERMTPAPVSGAAQWSRGRWLIVVNGAEPTTRQRFSLAHEFKHVLDSRVVAVLYPATPNMSSAERVEQTCDYFAACLLMPRPWVKRAWTTQTQDLRRLARRFEVSQRAMQVRLLQIGLVEPAARCGVAA